MFHFYAGLFLSFFSYWHQSFSCMQYARWLPFLRDIHRSDILSMMWYNVCCLSKEINFLGPLEPFSISLFYWLLHLWSFAPVLGLVPSWTMISSLVHFFPLFTCFPVHPGSTVRTIYCPSHSLPYSISYHLQPSAFTPWRKIFFHNFT